MNSAVQLYDKDGNAVYPRPYYRIGDFLESTNPNNPGDDGYIGTWELYGKGRVTVCIDPNDTDFNTIGKMVGEKEHTLTVDEMPTHTHNLNAFTSGSGSSGRFTIDPTWSSTSSDTESTKWIGNTTSIGSGQSHNNIPPSIVVYRWRRIA